MVVGVHGAADLLRVLNVIIADALPKLLPLGLLLGMVEPCSLVLAHANPDMRPRKNRIWVLLQVNTHLAGLLIAEKDDGLDLTILTINMLLDMLEFPLR